MYSKNSARMYYYRNHNMQQYESYDDDFKGFQKETQASGDEFSKETRKRNNFLGLLIRKTGKEQL